MTSSALVLLILGVSVSALSGDVYLGDAVVTNAYPNETLPNESLADGALPEDANPIDALSNLGFAYDKALATQHAALSFAAYCPNNAITSWSVGYVSRNYPDLKNIQVFEDGFAVYENAKLRGQRDTLVTTLSCRLSRLSSEGQATFRIGLKTSNLAKPNTRLAATAMFTMVSTVLTAH